MKHTVNGKDYEVVIEKKKNKNTYIRVKDDLKIYVTTSYFTTNDYIKKILNENNSFLSKTIGEFPWNPPIEIQWFIPSHRRRSDLQPDAFRCTGTE